MTLLRRDCPAVRFQTLAATGKVRLPTVESLKAGTTRPSFGARGAELAVLYTVAFLRLRAEGAIAFHSFVGLEPPLIVYNLFIFNSVCPSVHWPSFNAVSK